MPDTFRDIVRRQPAAPRRLAVVLAVLAAGVAGAAGEAAAALDVGLLRCEYRDDPVGLDEERPRFSWVARSPRRAERQSAYRVKVATTAAGARGEADVWDSGRVPSDENAHVAYGGGTLSPHTRYFWTVTLWNGEGRAVQSKPAFFETGFLHRQPWQARFIALAPAAESERHPFVGASWIWAPPATPGKAAAPRAADAGAERATHERVTFIRRFSPPPFGAIRAATLSVVAASRPLQFKERGGAVIAVNGKRWTPGLDDPRIQDVSEAIRPGENEIAIRVPAAGRSALLVRLEVQFEDGRTFRLGTDDNWRTYRFDGADEEGKRLPDPALQTREDSARAGGKAGLPARVLAKFGEAAGAHPETAAVESIVPPFHVRKRFTVEKPIASARLYATAAGVYHAELNGTRVGDDVLAPGWTEYGRRLAYQTHDVGKHLRRGENVLGAIVADGWYAGRTGFGYRVFGPEKGWKGELHIVYRDGSRQVIATDESWEGSTGPLVTSDLFMGETYDARNALPGWSAPGASPAGWRPVKRVSPPVGRLEAQSEPPVRALHTLSPKAITRPAPGVTIFDLGQNIVGWARLRVRAPAGTRIRLRHGEMLNKDGTLFTENLRSAKATDEYIAAGKGTEVYEPQFTFHGFQYVEVTGLPEGVRLGKEAITGIVAYSDLRPTGSFETSHALLNRLQQNIVWGQRGNFLSIPTDCPQRDERVGWSGDAQIFARTATFNMDSAAFLAKYVTALVDGQRADGAFGDFAPTAYIRSHGSFGWGDAGVIIPWQLYEAYGDRRVLEQSFPAMQAWVDFRTRGAVNGLNRSGGYGDWVSLPPETPKDVLGPMYHAHAARLLARAAGVLGKQEERARYDRVAADVVAAWQKAHLAPDGKITWPKQTAETQAATVLAQRLGMLSDEARPGAAARLRQAIERANGHLATGFLGTGHLLPALGELGEDALAYDLLLRETYPSWLYTVKNGATTMWERWNSYSPETGPTNVGGMNSYNHYAFGAVGEWMYENVAGLRPDPEVAGWKKIIVQPRIGGGLTFARAHHDSIRGRAASAWRVTGGQLTLDVEVPVHATARVHVPTTEPGAVEEGARALSQAAGVKVLESRRDEVVVSLGSGRYRFVAPFRAPAPRR